MTLYSVSKQLLNMNYTGIVFFYLCSYLVLAIDLPNDIFVSPSYGVDSSSCWTGEMPCATLNFALKGVQQSFSIVHLYPGIYTLDPGLGMQLNNRSYLTIFGMGSNG